MKDDMTLCPACGSAFGQRMRYPGPPADRYDLHFGEIALCSRCGLGAALPRRPQSELDAFYASGTYWSEAVGRSAAQTLHERNQCRHRVDRALGALRKTRSLRVLDVGAGHAWTAYWLDRASPGALETFDFIEPDETCSRAILARRAGHRTNRVPTLTEAEPGYHLIFLNHVLEHVAEPMAAVRRVRELLARRGIAYFETPNADQRFKADVFPHTWFFTSEALAGLGARAGMHEHLREPFGRMPERSGMELVWRASFRAACTLGLPDLAGRFDDLIWRYEPRPDGIWLRWLVGAPD